ncbi:Response regulator mcs4 [Fulvia fulva]|uniref:Response regulator mcs4 n=1 Tax=Passalora fulva TaxID=5499 RepID=A0A9Q8LHX6_PASFU|nr:Response regulator mcs4 [Fulvia fulva]KAK4624171.1 Response regulator mcs4 [Fulvia fulva]KAK4625556.1 Response regulator mcs4 [Fulvia fulva]UJO17810.1 Response regulator mcs4 [Fulvia fulva]WPV14963.1 Response regulator mcs4 [Fulvia fulva]WPV30140.1 Response regulator mcs4 [Fulvia fulva]
MPRFSLRPVLRRWSSRHSDKASTTSSNSAGTAATSPQVSPSPPPSASERRVLRQQSSLAKLRQRLGTQPGISEELPEQLPATTCTITRQPKETSSTNDSFSDESPLSGQPRTASDPTLHADTKRLGHSHASNDTVSQLDLPKTSSYPAPSDSSTDTGRTLTNTDGTLLEKTNRTPSPHSPSPHSPPRSPPPGLELNLDRVPTNPVLVVSEATPEALQQQRTHRPSQSSESAAASSVGRPRSSEERDFAPVRDRSKAAKTNSRHSSLNHSTGDTIVRTLVDAPQRSHEGSSAGIPVTGGSTEGPPTAGLRNYFTSSVPDMTTLLHRKIWVKRPGQSATLVQIKQDDLVDDVRDMILQKYRNSLGKTFDSPDMTLRIVSRSEQGAHRQERTLGPDEDMCRTVDTHYPGGQTVDDALIIDVPQKRTRPTPSPGGHRPHSYYANDDFRPQENGTDYFPPMPAAIQPTLPHTAAPPGHHLPVMGIDHPRSISVLNTGQVPPLPSPGGRSRGHRSEREHRPKYGRQHTASPTGVAHANSQPMVNPTLPHRTMGRPRVDSSASEAQHMLANGVPPAPPLPTPPVSDLPVAMKRISQPSTPSGVVPPAMQHGSSRPKKTRKPTPDKVITKRTGTPQSDPYGTNPALPNVSSMLDASVPPINVLIVEDNIINLRILEGLMKRLKVRWQTAMNGQIAVDKWKGGGYHLVLMDIQMPIMNGLQATREIRRLERVNGIGVFSESTPGSPNGEDPNANGEDNGKNDRLDKSDGLFKSPVIIVALTASSLQSDRHEALAAGCNDFLTKPVNFVWLERKVKEWGCMQALIDFDGWRKWKDYAAKEEEGKSEEQKQKDRDQEEKQKKKMEKMALLQEKQRQRKEEEERRKRRESSSENTASQVNGAKEETNAALAKELPTAAAAS